MEIYICKFLGDHSFWKTERWTGYKRPIQKSLQSQALLQSAWQSMTVPSKYVHPRGEGTGFPFGCHNGQTRVSITLT